jgi:SAM-dependent methyltransferase
VTGRVIEPLLDAARVRAGQAVLDLATGPGHVAAGAAARGAVTTGIDVAEAMVELAGELHPGIEFVQASAADLPFEEASFDAVVGNFAILHVGEPERVAREIVRVLRPAGSVALSTWDVPERALMFAVMLDAIVDAGALPPDDLPPGPPFFRFSDDGEFTRLLGTAPLEDAEVQTIEFPQTFPSSDVLWEGMVGATVRTGPLVTSQTEEMQQRIRAAFEGRVSEFRTNDEIELPMSVKIASARKARP